MSRTTPKQTVKTAYKEKIRVTFLGNRPMDWQGPESSSSITSPSAVQAPVAQSPLDHPSQPSVFTSSPRSPSDERISSDSETSVPKTNEELRNKLIAYLKDEIKRHTGSHNDPDADYFAPDNHSKQLRADKAKGLVGLQIILCDPSSKVANVQDLDADMRNLGCESFNDYQRVKCETLARHVNFFTSTWGLHGPAKEVDEDSEEEDIEAEIDEGNDPDPGPEIDEEADQATPRKRKRTGKALPMLVTTDLSTSVPVEASSAGPSKGKGKVKEEPPTRSGRSAADKRAQEKVPKWYGGRCVLSGDSLSQGAHIIPVRAAGKVDISFWDILRFFWPVDRVKDIVVEGHEVFNILPLSYNAHKHWDKFHFALRPIHHLTDPQHRLYLQMVWSKDFHHIGQSWIHSNGTVVDFRHPVDESHPEAFHAVRHGDVFELVTSDAEKFPLPSFHFLEIQFAIHKLMGGMEAAGGLAAIFGGGDPPDDEGPLPKGMEVPFVWKFLIDAAHEAEVLDDKGATLWKRCIARRDGERRLESRRWLHKAQRWLPQFLEE